jgi:hypothetical protein
MPRWLKILLVIGASGVLLLGLAIGGFVWWLNANREEFRKDGLAAEAEGERYGLGKSSPACIDESLTRLERSSFLQQALLSIFLKSCLHSAPRDPALCAGVPATSEMVRSAFWRNEICAAHGKPGDQACARLLGAIQDVCHPKP